MNRKKLTDILLSNSAREQLAENWNHTAAAGDFAPLPAGIYVAHVQSVELFNARTGTAGVKIQFKVAEGEHAGRVLFHDCWLTPAALPQTKRDCGKLGLMTLDQLETANVPPGRIRCKLRVTLRTDDNGEQHDRVRQFDVLGVDEPAADAFAPPDTNAAAADAPPSSSAAAVPADTPSELPPAADAFPFGANVAGGAP